MPLFPHVNLSVYCNCLIGRLDAVLAANFMEQSPSNKANRSSAGQEIPHISWNLKFRYHIHKFHYRIHKCPSPFPIHSQRINPSWRSCETFCNIVRFCGEKLLAENYFYESENRNYFENMKQTSFTYIFIWVRKFDSNTFTTGERTVLPGNTNKPIKLRHLWNTS